MEYFFLCIYTAEVLARIFVYRSACSKSGFGRLDLLLVVAFVSPLLGYYYFDHDHNIRLLGSYIHENLRARASDIGVPDAFAWESSPHRNRQRWFWSPLFWILIPGLFVIPAIGVVVWGEFYSDFTRKNLAFIGQREVLLTDFTLAESTFTLFIRVAMIPTSVVAALWVWRMQQSVLRAFTHNGAH